MFRAITRYHALLRATTRWHVMTQRPRCENDGFPFPPQQSPFFAGRSMRAPELSYTLSFC